MRIREADGERRAPPRSDVAGSYPRWVHWATTVPPLLFAVMVVVDAGAFHEGTLSALGVALVLVSVLPWFVGLVVELHPLVLGAAVLVPQVVLHVGGKALDIATLTDEDPSHGALFVVVWIAGEVAATAPPRRSALFSAAAAATVAGRWIAEPAFDSGPFWIAGVAAATIIGLMLYRGQSMVVDLRAAQDALARDAVLHERHRIAREVHDVIAHTLTVTMMHVTAARLALRRDTDRAEEALAEAERLGRQSLGEIRRTVALLRAAADDPAEPPQPGVGDLATLVAAYEAAGMDVAFSPDEHLPVSPAVGLALFRVLQESLANAAKHAPGAHVDVALRRDGERAVLTVRNGAPARSPARGGGGGMGLVGMRERASLLDGDLSAGPVGDGGWRVRLVFALAADDPAGSSSDRTTATT